MATSDLVDTAARRLRESEESCIACTPVREILGATDVAVAYAVQDENTRLGVARGRRIAGRKIGLTARAVQAQFGVDQPDTGVLFADMAVNDGDPLLLRTLLAPRAEAEVAFVFDHDLTHEVTTAADVLRATAFVLPAIEIVDSRIKGWDITIVDTVADNASSARYVVGTTPRLLSDVDLRAASMSMTRNGEEMSSGVGAACLGNPVNAVVWLANALSARGESLKCGDVVLSGALGPMARVDEPGHFEATISGLGSVRVTFE